MVVWLSKVSYTLRRITAPVAVALNGGGVGAVVIIMLFIVGSILLRYLFVSTLLCAYIHEVTEFMLVVLVFFGLGYTTLRKGHVAVDILVLRLPHRTQAVIDSITYFLGTGLFSVLAWRNIVEAKAMALGGEASIMLSIPVFPFVIIVALGCAVGALLLLVCFLDSLAEVVKK